MRIQIKIRIKIKMKPPLKIGGCQLPDLWQN